MTTAAAPPRVRIIHETNPDKYFPALLALEAAGGISIVGKHRYSVVKELIRSRRRDRLPWRTVLVNAFSDLSLRTRLWRIRNEVVVLGFAPWDWRIILFTPLARRNHIVYHTSWPYWEMSRTPRRYLGMNRLLRRHWIRFLRHPNVHVVAVLPEIKDELELRFGVISTVIPHAAPDLFYAASQTRAVRPVGNIGLRLLYVGELSDKKGVGLLLEQFEDCRHQGIHLTLVGDGPLREECRRASQEHARIFWHGRAESREELAKLLAHHDVLVLLSRRERNWEELFGIVIIEALAAGLGVIATDHVGPRSIFAGADLGNIFADGDLAGPKALVKRLAESSAERTSFINSHRGIADAYHERTVLEAWKRVLMGLSR